MTNGIQNIIKQIQNETDIFAKAKLISVLVHEKNIRIIDLAKSMGKTSSYICHLLRLTSLPDMIIDGYYSELISISHLFIISRIKDQKKLLEVYEQLLKDNFTIQQTEEIVREVLYGIQKSGKHLEKDELMNLINKIKETNTDIKIKAIQTRIKGKIILEFKGNLETTSKALKMLLAKLSQ